MANTDLRQLAKESGVYLWQVAEVLNMNDSNFSRKLPETEKQKIRDIIADLKAKAAI